MKVEKDEEKSIKGRPMTLLTNAQQIAYIGILKETSILLVPAKVPKGSARAGNLTL